MNLKIQLLYLGNNVVSINTSDLRNGVYVEDSNGDYLTFVFVDKELGIVGKLNLNIDPNNPDKLEWKLYSPERLTFNISSAKREIQGFSVPQELILRRVSHE